MVTITTKGKKSWVTFSLNPNEGEQITLCGEWSDWKSEPMKIKKSGEAYIRKIFPIGQEYQFGYKVNERDWRCDETLDCVLSPFGSKNSLLKI